MPKTLFYSGIIFCSVIALLAGTAALQQLHSAGTPASFLPLEFVTQERRYVLLVAFLGCVSLGSIFLRMASLVAPRNLFAAFSAALSVASVVVSAAFVTAAQFRLAAVGGSGNHLQHVTNDVAALLFGVMLFSLRPYFQVQASRMLSLLAALAGAALMMVVGLQLSGFSSGSSGVLLSNFATASFHSLLFMFFAANVVHCLRHRHLFTEVTSLRELLDSRSGRRIATTRDGVGFGGGVAYDS